MSSFTITTPEASVNLRPSSVKRGETADGTATYSVTNRTGATIRARLRVEPGGGAEQSWFTVRDGDECDIAPGATVSISIDLAVPGGSESHSFNVVVVNLADPDNDFESGSTIAFDAPATEQPNGGVKWWYIAAPITLLLVVGGVIGAFFLWFVEESVTLADFRGGPLEEAQEALAAQGIQRVEEALDRGAPEFAWQKFYDQIVIKQTPESDGTLEIPLSTQVKLGWRWIPKKVTVPTNLVNFSFKTALKAIEKAGLRFSGSTGPTGARPSNRHLAAVKSVSPTGQQDAETGISFEMKWRQVQGIRPDVLRNFNSFFIENRNVVIPRAVFRPNIIIPPP